MKTEKLCKNCKFWRRGGSLNHEHGIFGNRPDVTGEIIIAKGSRGVPIVCSTDSKSEFGICLHPSIGSDYTNGWLGREDRMTDGVYAGCDEERAGLEVGQDFGCIHFQDK